MDIMRYKESKKVSVVIPIYNGEKYLSECLECIVNQTYKELEIICVDDKSTDTTFDILRQYQERDARIIIIRNEANLHAAESRNKGLKAATGKYVLFLDADDIFERDMIEILHHKMEMEKAEVCFFGFSVFYGECKKSKALLYPKEYNKNEELPLNWLTYVRIATWNRMCSRSFLEKNDILFQSLSSSNDAYWSQIIQIKAKRICFFKEKPLVHYRTGTENQISAKRNPKNILYAYIYLMDSLENNMDIVLFRQINVSLIKEMIRELNTFVDNEELKRSYLAFSLYLNKHKERLVFRNEIYDYCLNSFITLPYENKWFLMENLVVFFRKKEFTNELEKHQKIVLWGNGKFGKLFQNFCRQNSINLLAVTDSQNKNIGNITECGFNIISTHKVIEVADCIVACNDEVFEMLEGREEIMPVLINLREYFTFD